jgi:hypothetical protein
MLSSSFSRYLFCQGLKDSVGRLYLSDRVPYRYRALTDNRFHTVAAGESLFSIAHVYFTPLPRASQFFWILAEFQPEPIVDATLKLKPGTQLVIPSVRTLIESIFNEARREEFTG